MPKIRSVVISCLGALLLLGLPGYGFASSYSAQVRPCNRDSRPNQCRHLFNEGRAAVQLGQIDKGRARWGYIDRSGQVVIAPRFSYVMPFMAGSAAVFVDGKWGYIDRAGDWILQPQYRDASPFNDQGTALVVNNAGRLQLIDQSGRVRKTFAPGARLGYGIFANGANTAILEVPVVPVLWRIRDGKAHVLPDGVKDVGQPTAGWIPALAGTGRYGGHWGYLDEAMNWAVKPQQLQSSNQTLTTDGQAVRVMREGNFDLLDARGKPLVSAAKRIRLLVQGVWLVQSTDDAVSIVDSEGRELAALGTDTSPTVLHRMANMQLAYAVTTDTQLALVGNDGAVHSYDFRQPHAHANGHYLFVREGSSADGPLLQVFDGQGAPMLDAATLGRIHSDYTAYALLGDYPALADATVFVATLSPADYDEPGALLTSTGAIVTATGWWSADNDQSMLPVAIVATQDDKYGVVDSHGDWRVEPHYDAISDFKHGMALARTGGHYSRDIEGLDKQGHTYAIPEHVRQSMHHWYGDMLVYTDDNADGSRRYGLWDLRAGKPLSELDFDAIKDFREDHALARKGKTWGDLDRSGHWQPIAGLKRYSRAERQGDFYVIKQYHNAADSSADRYSYQLFSLQTGAMVATGLGDKPVLLNADRVLLQFADGSTVLADAGGHVLARLERTIDKVVAGERFVVLKTDNRYGAIDDQGGWLVQPTLASRQKVRAALTDAGHVVGEMTGQEADSDRIKFAVSDTRTFGFKDAQGNKIIDARFDKLGIMVDGRALAMARRRYGNLWGYVDRDGRFAITPQYDFALPFYRQRAFVGKAGEQAYIDPQGNIIARFVRRCDFIVVLDADGQRHWPDEPLDCPQVETDTAAG